MQPATSAACYHSSLPGSSRPSPAMSMLPVSGSVVAEANASPSTSQLAVASMLLMLAATAAWPTDSWIRSTTAVGGDSCGR